MIDLVSKSTIPFKAIDKLPLVSFCRPSTWRNQLDELSAEHGISLNVVLEADSIRMQTNIVAGGGLYALLGPNAIAAAWKMCRIRSARIVNPSVTRYTALAMSRHGQMTLAFKTVMHVTRDLAGARTGLS